MKFGGHDLHSESLRPVLLYSKGVIFRFIYPGAPNAGIVSGQDQTIFFVAVVVYGILSPVCLN